MQRRETAHQFGIAEWGLSSVLSLTWGSSFLLIAVVIDHFHPSMVPFGRSLAGAAALACFRGSREPIPARHWPRIAVLGLVWMALPFWLFPLAEQTVTSGVAGMMNGGLPVVTALITALWVRRVPSRKRMFAIVLGFAGIAIIAAPAARGVGPCVSTITTRAAAPSRAMMSAMRSSQDIAGVAGGRR